MAAQEVTLRFKGDQAHIRSVLKEVKSAHAQTASEITKDAKAQAQSAIALQRQRSAALITIWKADTRAVIREEQERVRASVSLQRQRSAALIAQWKADQREQLRIARETQRQQEAASKSGISGLAAGAVGGAVALIGSQAVGLIRSAASAWIDYASKLEQSKIAFTTMLGSAQRAEAHLRALQEFAKTTPFEFPDLIAASQRMQALGFSANQVVPVLNDVGNAVAAAGGGAERLDRVVLALSQIQSKGKVATQELNQLAESGIPAFRILEEHLGKSRAEISKLVEKGKIGSDVFLEAFRKFSQANFGGLMEQQSRTFLGALSNMKDGLLQLTATAFEPLYRKISEITIRIADGITKGKPTLEQAVRSVLEGLGEIVANVGINLGQMLAENIANGITNFSFNPVDLYKRFQPLQYGFLKGITDRIADASMPTKTLPMDYLTSFRGPSWRAGAFRRGGGPTGAPSPTGGGGGGRSRSDTTSRQAFESAMRNADLAERESLAITAAQTTANKRELDLQIKDIKQFTDDQIVIKNNEAVANLARLNAESQANFMALQKRLITLQEFKDKERELNIKTADIIEKNNVETFNLEVERDRQLAQAEIDAKRRELAILEQLDDQEITRIKDRVDRGILAESEGEKQIAAILAQGFERRRKALEAEEKSFATTLERRKDINAELIQLDKYRVFSAEQSSQKINDARMRELVEMTPPINRGRPIPEPGGNVLSPEVLQQMGAPPVDRWQALRDIMRSVKESAVDFGTAMRNEVVAGIDAVGASLAEGVLAWAVYGKSFGEAMKQALAGAAAAFAAEMIMQSVRHAAYALGSLAFGDFAGAAKHGAAAAKFLAAAAVGAAAAKAIGGGGSSTASSAFQSTVSTGGAGGGSGSSQSSQPKPIDIGRDSFGSIGRIELALKGDLGDLVEAKWIERYDGGGRLRNKVRTDGRDV